MTEDAEMEYDGGAGLGSVDGTEPFDGGASADGVNDPSGMDRVERSSRSEDNQSRSTSPRRRNSRTGHFSASRLSPSSAQVSQGSSFFALASSNSAGAVSAGSLRRGHPSVTKAAASHDPIPVTHDEALLVHHYTEHLGRWLDCTDATRQFTLGVPEKVRSCPVLLNAVLSFAARHRRDDNTATVAYQRCINLLISRLDEDAASHDETLLCAIVILRFYEQLSGARNDLSMPHTITNITA